LIKTNNDTGTHTAALFTDNALDKNDFETLSTNKIKNEYHTPNSNDNTPKRNWQQIKDNLQNHKAEDFETVKSSENKTSYSPKILFSEGQKLYEYMINNPTNYRINAEGKLIRTNGLPIKTSNIDDVIYHFFNQSVGNVTPPGYNSLKITLRNDKYAQDLFKQYNSKAQKNKRSRTFFNSNKSPQQFHINQWIQ
jgi:hypothetical protein